jgi:hypothetical protein
VKPAELGAPATDAASTMNALCDTLFLITTPAHHFSQYTTTTTLYDFRVELKL